MHFQSKRIQSRLLQSCVVLTLILSLLPPATAVSVQEPTLDVGMPTPPLPASDPAMNVLYPDELDPPESCGVPQRGPFGQDVEVLLGPWFGGPKDAHKLDLAPDWNAKTGLVICDNGGAFGATAISDIAAVARGGDEIVAVWNEGGALGGELYWSTWSASAREDHFVHPSSPGGWYCSPGPLADDPHRLAGLSPDGNPAILSRAPQHWAVFARQGVEIWVREWANGVLGEWYALDGVMNAASDPAVVSKDPGHMAVFYRSADGAVWFTEWNGWAWRERPLSLSDTELSYTVFMPVATKNHSGATSSTSVAAALEPHAAGLSATPTITLTSELSAASRDAKHLAVFGVDADNQLWVREWTHRDESDWSDTQWVKLMENVAVERPSVASRHSNHLGVAVRDTSGQAHYVEWAYNAGWKDPLSLAGAPGETHETPLTLAATSIHTMSVFGVFPSTGGMFFHRKDWSEDGGWSAWQAMGYGWADGQTMTAVVRRMDDVMLLWVPWGGPYGDFQHYSTLDRTFSHSPITSPGSTTLTGYARGQALAWVDGEVLWAAAQVVGGGAWKVDALGLSSGITASLPLPAHPFSELWGALSLTAGDLDFDGDEEVIVATLDNGVGVPEQTVSVSLLDFVVSPTLALSATPSVSAPIPIGAFDVSAAIGDLDGDGRQDEAAIVYRTGVSTGFAEVLIYEYVTATHTLDYRGSASVGVLQGDIEIAIGKLYDGQLLDEQLVVGSTQVSLGGDDANRSQGQVEVYGVTISPTVSIYRTDTYTHVFAGPVPGFQHDHSSDLATGDLDADGMEEVIYSFWSGIVMVDYDAQGTGTSSPFVLFEAKPWSRSLALGDLDRDGRDEIVITGHHVETSFGSIVELMDEGQLKASGTLDTSYLDIRTVLIGDLDNDSLRSKLVGCANEVAEVSVIAVVNGPPRWYQGGMPIQVAEGAFARTTEAGSEDMDGSRFNYGASLSVGIEAEISIPFIGTKIGEIRSSVTTDFMGSVGQSRATHSATTATSGYHFSGDSNPTQIGLVVFYETDYRCLYYDVYPPGHPENSSRAMACSPSGQPYEQVKSLEDWHSLDWKVAAGPSWADVGHPFTGDVTTANDVTTYDVGNSPPADPYQVRWHDPGSMSKCVIGGQSPVGYDWALEESQGEERIQSGSSDVNVTVSAGATAGIVTVDTSVTAGYGSEWSRSVSWGSALSMSGSVNQYNTDVCPTCQDYVLTPYVYEATTTTGAGATYSYLEWDYYVRQMGGCSRMAEKGAPCLARREAVPQ